MKKLTLLSMIFFCSIISGQTLVVTPYGLRDSTDLEKTFVIINIDGKSAKELYDIAIKYVNKNYKSTNDDIKGNIDGEYISFNTHFVNFVTVVINLIPLSYDASHTIELNFKDGKVKYEVINLQMNYRQTKEPFLYNGKNSETILDKNKGISPFLFIGKLLIPGIYTPNLRLKRPKAKAQIENYFNTQIKSLTDALNGKSNNNNW